MNSGYLFRTLLILLLPIPMAMAQDAASTAVTVPPAVGEAAPHDLVLQPNDEIVLRSLQVKEIADKTFRLDQEGDINVPLIGRIRLVNLTGQQAEELLKLKLKVYYLEPDLQLNISSVHSEAISVIGAVGNPGVHEIKGRTRLLDALSLGGGIRGEAGPVVVLTRQAEYGPIPRPEAHRSTSGESIAEIDLKSLLDAREPAENVLVQPHDMISVPPAQMVYVIGTVKHAGGFTLNGNTGLSVLQALSRAEGLDVHASAEGARILRRRGTQQEQQIPLDLKKILAGKAEDVEMAPNDILFVQSSTARVVTSRTIDAAIQIATGMLVFATHF